MKCMNDNCGKEAAWLRVTQFAGEHPFCSSCAELENNFSQNDSYQFWEKIEEKIEESINPEKALERAEIKGRTDAMEWCIKLVAKWRKEHEEFEEWRLKQSNPESHLSLNDQFADELEEHIDQFANR
jgi:hypothetical protein